MDPSDQATLIGKVIGNLLSLEFLMRVYLYDRDVGPHTPLAGGANPYDGAVGDRFPLNALTSYAPLREILTKYNERVALEDSALAVDPSLAELRDALAHGRSSARADDAEQLSLIKFSKPDAHGMVSIVFRANLSREWLGSQVARTHDELMKVARATGATKA